MNSQSKPSATDSRAIKAFAGEVLDSLPAHIAVLDSRGVIISVNQAWRSFAQENGGDKASYVGANYLAVCEQAQQREHDDTVEAAFAGLGAVLRGQQEQFMLEYPCHSPTEERWFIVRASRFSSEASVYLVIEHLDITARKLAEMKLQEREEEWRRLFAILPVGVSIIDIQGAIVELNSALERILQIPKEGLASGAHRKRIYLNSNSLPMTREDLPSTRAIKEQKIVQDVEICVVKEDGGKVWTNVSAAPLPFPGAGAVIVTSDITARKQAELELIRAKEALEELNQQLQQAIEREQHLARTDGLTGLNNRRHFFDLATHEFAVAKRYRHPLSALLFDIDLFKHINDQFGHQVGDEIIKQVVQMARGHLRDADVLARYGGDEFIVLSPQTKAQQLAVVGERIRQDIASIRFATDQGTASVTTSVGIADGLFPNDTLDRLIQRADQALYSAKVAGRNRVALFHSSG